MYPKNVDRIEVKDRATPLGVLGSSGLIVALALVSCLLAPSLIRATAVVVAGVLAWFMVGGSRIAWCIALLDALGRLGEALIVREGYWELAVYGAIVCGLSVPTSFRFVWRGHWERPTQVKPGRVLHRSQEVIYLVFDYFVSWERGMKREGPWDAEGYRSMLGRIGLFTLFSLPLVVATYKWDQNSVSPVASVLADVAWTSYAIFQVTFIVLCGIGLYRYLTRNRSHSTTV